MNKNIRSKLKMEKPEYYDCTDNKAVVVQKPEIEKTVRKSYWHGFQLGSLWGSFGVGISTLLALVTSNEFNFFLEIDGPTWKAIFILVTVISAITFLILGFKTLFAFWRGNFKESKIIEEFFNENKKL